MKLILESWKHYLNEIGDAGKEPYKFKAYSAWDETFYEFKTEGGYEYEVNFYDDPDDEESLDFHIDFQTKQKKYSRTKEGNPLKIMSTIVHIIKDFLKGRSESEYPITFVFDGARKPGEEEDVESTRTRLYKKYIKKILGEDVEFWAEEDPNHIKFVVEEKPQET